MIKMKYLLFFVFFINIFSHTISEPVEDKQALLDFFHSINHSRLLNWNETTSVCKNWTGVFCNVDQSRVIAVRLHGAGLRGPIPAKTLSRLSELKILSLRLNSISGPFPPDFSELENLSSLYLQFNKFSGPLPLSFSVWKNLSVINLSNNGFNGTIPSSISTLTHLAALNLGNNSLSGQIPYLNLPGLQQLDLSNNNLSGNVPKSLQRFPNWVFSGNNLTTENAFPPAIPVEPPKQGIRLGESAILGIALGSSVVGFVIIAMLMIVCCSRRNQNKESTEKAKKKELVSVKKNAFENQVDKNNSLKFFKDCEFVFDLEDLLRASAEVLGKGTFGTSYKAALEDSTTVVVKRSKEGSTAKREFESLMEMVGNIKHENVDSLRAYYYSKDEKLMIYDYHEQGSISAMLHGKRSEGHTPLDWETRLRIAIGAARGIAHIHTQNNGRLFHGNIKASNIFLNSKSYGLISDIGLATLINPTPPPATRSTGYRAPEVTDTRKSTHESDVYSFGVLLLELLTGKSPVHSKGGEEVAVHLVRWVNSVVREEWTAEVFDVELLKYPNIDEEMVEMLQVGLACVGKMPGQRPKMVDVLLRIEQVYQASTGISSATKNGSSSNSN